MSGRSVSPSFLVALALLSSSCWPMQVALASNGDFSYFYGKIAPTDTLCAKKVVGIGTKTPVQVEYSSSQRPITAVSLAASNVAYQGFSAFITRGAIGRTGVTFSLSGPWILPYYVELDYYCAQ